MAVTKGFILVYVRKLCWPIREEIMLANNEFRSKIYH